MLFLANKSVQDYAIISEQKRVKLCYNKQTKACKIMLYLANKSVENYAIISKQKRVRFFL